MTNQSANKPVPKGKATIGAAALALIAGVVALEGGYVNHKSDPGGETNKGITKAVAVKHGYTGPMRTLPDDVVYSIYYETYLVRYGLEPLIAIDAAVTEELFDTTVNMGPSRPSRWFQQSTNQLCGARLAVDGQVGKATTATFKSCQKAKGAVPLCLRMLGELDAAQLAEYQRLVRVNPRLKVFYKGWTNHRIGNVNRSKCGSKP